MLIEPVADSGSGGTYYDPYIPRPSHTHRVYAKATSDYRDRFYKFLRRWRFETLHLSSIETIAEHPDFQAIVRMGDLAIPLIVEEIRTRPDHLMLALKMIANEDPVRAADRGNMAEMANAWISWFDRRN